MQRQGQNRQLVSRVAHAGLLCIYTLAAVLGLFLHSPQESNGHFGHVCGASSPDLTRPDGAPVSDHDEARCGLCHLHARLAAAIPEASSTPQAPPSLTGSVDAPRASMALSAPLGVPPSRGPPSRSV